MRTLTLIVPFLAASPALANENEAEKLYRAMEKKILVAKTLVVEFDSQHTVGDEKFTVKGTIHLAPGNKARFDLESEIFQLGGKNLIVTNGEVKYAKVGEVIFKEGPFPPKGKVLLSLIAEFGAAGAALEQKITTAELNEDFPVKNFKLGPKEMIGQREAQVVQYQLENKKLGSLAEMSLWIDTKTGLPLKRTMAEKQDGKEVRMTETYSVFTVDSRLDDKLFEVQKE